MSPRNEADVIECRMFLILIVCVYMLIERLDLIIEGAVKTHLFISRSHRTMPVEMNPMIPDLF